VSRAIENAHALRNRNDSFLRLTAHIIREFLLASFVVQLQIFDKPVTVLVTCKMPETALKDTLLQMTITEQKLVKFLYDNDVVWFLGFGRFFFSRVRFMVHTLEDRQSPSNFLTRFLPARRVERMTPSTIAADKLNVFGCRDSR
jgi:hypothetical protein